MSQLQKLLIEVDDLMEALWDIYVLSGADPSGYDGKFNCSVEEAIKRTVDAVKELRDDYESALPQIQWP